MEIYIVRHGETVWNEQKRLQGSVDIELNENGRELAGVTGRQLEGIQFDCIYSSPLIRAYETACLLRGYRNIPIIRDERLRELCFGENEGRSAAEMLQDPENSFRFFFDDPNHYVAPKCGESLEELCERTAAFMTEIIEPQAKSRERIMIVAHGAANKAIMCHVKGHGKADFWSGGLQKNCGVIILDYDGEKYQILEETKVFY